MKQPREAMTEILTERLCGEVARRDDAGLARRLYRKQVVDGGYRLDEGALRDECFQCLRAIGVMALLEEVHGTARPREMVPFVQSLPALGAEDLVWSGAHPGPAKWAVQ